MIVHFSKTLVEKIIKDESTVYAQIPFVHNDYFDFESEITHLLSLEISKEKAKDSESYYEGYYPYYRHLDINTFTELLSI